MNNAFLCERTPCLPDDILLNLSPQLWQRQPQQLLNHLQDLSHLHCCIPKLLSHNHRGLRKLFYRLSRTSKPIALPFLETLLDLLYSLNPEGTWLQAVGMNYLVTEVKIFTLLAEWFHKRIEIKEWLLSLAAAPRLKRKYCISIAEWYLLPAQAPPVKENPLPPLLSPSRRSSVGHPQIQFRICCSMWTLVTFIKTSRDGRTHRICAHT